MQRETDWCAFQTLKTYGINFSKPREGIWQTIVRISKVAVSKGAGQQGGGKQAPGRQGGGQESGGRQGQQGAGREVRASKEAVKRAINRAIVSWLQRRTREVNSSEFTSPFVLFLRQVSQFYLSLKTFS
jgi:hypothetical protein